MSGFELSPGVVIDPGRDEAYLMDPRGEIVAVDLAKGKEVWRSQKAAKLLALSGDVLIGQAEGPAAAAGLKIVTLNIDKEGKPIAESVVPLPPNVSPAIDQAASRSFTARATPGAGETTVSWEFVDRPLRGVARGPLQALPGEAPPGVSADGPGSIPTAAPPAGTMVEPGSQPAVIRGAARINLSSGAIIPAAAPHLATVAEAPVTQSGPDVPSDAALDGVPHPQFLSVDGRHILSSQRVADDPEWNKYRWSLYDRDSAAFIGKFDTHVRYAPFVVINGRAIYQTAPYARRIDDALVDQPAQIHAIDVTNGAHLWDHAIRDTVDRRPRPP